MVREVLLLTALASLAPAQTIYRTPDGQERRIGNPSYDGRFVFTRIRYSGRCSAARAGRTITRRLISTSPMRSTR